MNKRTRLGAAASAAVLTTLLGAGTASADTYTVKPGDTLWGIAASHRASLGSVFAANHMDGTTVIHPGQTITVDAQAPATPASSADTYTVQPGDSLWGIGLARSVSLQTLFELNGLDANSVIHPGQAIRLASPKATQPAAPAPKSSKPAPKPLLGLTITPPKPKAATSTAPKAGTTHTAPTAPSVTTTDQVKTLVRDEATLMGVDPSLGMAFAYVESSFRPVVTSSAGAIGPMQIMPANQNWVNQLTGRPINLNDARDNIDAGLAIVRQLINTSPSVDIAIASYYQGQYSVQLYGMFDSTKAYVASIRQAQAMFQ